MVNEARAEVEELRVKAEEATQAVARVSSEVVQIIGERKAEAQAMKQKAENAAGEAEEAKEAGSVQVEARSWFVSPNPLQQPETELDTKLADIARAKALTEELQQQVVQYKQQVQADVCSEVCASDLNSCCIRCVESFRVCPIFVG